MTRKNGSYWFLVAENEKGCLYQQKASKKVDAEVIGYVVCKKKVHKAGVVMGKSYPERVKPCTADSDFGYSAWQLQRDELPRAERMFNSL